MRPEVREGKTGLPSFAVEWKRAYTTPTACYRSQKKSSRESYSGRARAQLAGRLHPLYTEPAPMQYEYALYVSYTIVRATNPKALYFLMRAAVKMRGNLTFKRENVCAKRIQLHGTRVQWNSNTHSDTVTSDTENCHITTSMSWGRNSQPELNGPTHLLVRDEWENLRIYSLIFTPCFRVLKSFRLWTRNKPRTEEILTKTLYCEISRLVRSRIILLNRLHCVCIPNANSLNIYQGDWMFVNKSSGQKCTTLYANKVYVFRKF